MQKERLATRARALFDMELTAVQLEMLHLFERELVDWNANRANLTGITEEEEIEIKHFLDSFSILRFLSISQQARVADVGTGAGFPGLVLKILRPDLEMALIESVGKKADFLVAVTEKLGLTGVEVVNMRAEDAGNHHDYRETYDLVVARAVAQMPVLAEYMIPLCRLGGCCIAMKGATALKEVEHGMFAIEVLGGRFVAMHTVTLPALDEPHLLIVIEKSEATPKNYPRRAGIAAKRPLLLQEDRKSENERQPLVIEEESTGLDES